MKFAALGLLAMLALLAGCETNTGPRPRPVSLDEMFQNDAQPVGDPSMDPYRPEVARPLINIPAGPKPSAQKSQTGGTQR